MIVLPKIKNRISHTTQQFNSIPGYTPKRTESGDLKRYYAHILITVLFTIARGRSNPSIHRQMNRYGL